MKAHKLGDDMKEETRIALLEQSIGHIGETLIRFEKRFDKIDTQFELIQNDMKFRFERVEKRLDTIDSDMKTGVLHLDSKIDSRFIWMLSFVAGGFAGLFGMMAHAMHWL